MSYISELHFSICCACVTRSEEEMLKFLAGQNSIWSICGRDVLTAFDLSPFTQIYDLGGEHQ